MILKKLFIIILRPLRPWRLCGRYSEFHLSLCRARTLAIVMNRISTNSLRHCTSITRPSPFVARQPLLVPAVVDASVGQGNHATGNPHVEYCRRGILQELPGRG